MAAPEPPEPLGIDEPAGTPDLPGTAEPPGTPEPPGAPGSPGATAPPTRRRLRFPSNDVNLATIYSDPKVLDKDHDQEKAGNDDDDVNNGHKAAGEPDREPSAHRNWWESVHNWAADFRKDFGSADPGADVQNLMGDIGIDLHAIHRVIRGKRSRRASFASLVRPPNSMARPGISGRTPSSSTVPTLGSSTSPSGLSSTSPSGSATPLHPRKFGVGVDAHDVANALKKLKKRMVKRDSNQAKYAMAKAELAHRRNLVLLMVYCFMAYGAPSHRMEYYVLALLKALDMDGRCNYTVGCTEICFINPIDPNDPMTRSAYTTLVKANGLDIGACETAFRVYRSVVHGQVTVEEASQTLADLMRSPCYYKPWTIVPFYGFASALVCVWGFGGYWLDMPVAFILGSLVGVLQVICASKNRLYSNVLEVTACLITSFAARAFSSIGGDQKYFCFASVAESSISTILPGYIVLCGSLELQSKSITAGSTRLFYAVIYSLLLGYGIDVGSQLWAVMYPNAPTSTTCPRASLVDPRWKILLVPVHLVVQSVLIRSRPHQIPVQVVIGSAAYAVNYFVNKHATAQVADTASAFVLGVLGHLWARFQRAFAFAAVVAGIMILVPSGLSAQGGLVTGITLPLFNNGSQSAEKVYQDNIYQSFSVGAQMIQVAVGLSVGIFISALVVYPMGKKNNALFSF